MLTKTQMKMGTILKKLDTCFDPELADQLEVVNLEGDELLLKVAETGETFTSTAEILSAFYQLEEPLTKDSLPELVSREALRAISLLRTHTTEASHGGFSQSGLELTTLLYALKEKADKLSGKEALSPTVNKLAIR